MKPLLYNLIALIFLFTAGCANEQPVSGTSDERTLAFHALQGTPLIDGFATDSAGENAELVRKSTAEATKQPNEDKIIVGLRPIQSEKSPAILQPSIAATP